MIRRTKTQNRTGWKVIDLGDSSVLWNSVSAVLQLHLGGSRLHWPVIDGDGRRYPGQAVADYRRVGRVVLLCDL
jgi:hypothetical protein